jgi:hypothetical protein
MKKLKNIIFFGITLLAMFSFLTSCLSRQKTNNLSSEIRQKVNIIVNDRKIFLAYKVYKIEKENMRLKYKVEDCNTQSDLSAINIDNEYGMHELFGENDSRKIIDPLGDKILSKWNKLNYDPNYYFHYDQVVSDIHLSFLKMMDFYISEDMKKYEDSLSISLIKRYNSKDPILIKFLNNEYNFKNRMIWKHQNDSILTLIPLNKQ